MIRRHGKVVELLALDRSKPAKVALTVAINILGVGRAVAPVSKDLEGAAALDKPIMTERSRVAHFFGKVVELQHGTGAEGVGEG
eukprot:CAMPEP_0179483024 /NCGR_PEP_ID=MMETSP0799-20121207/60358_1 /TAXON_ID=46947 /ORGANISM="Geminigera cryophila, Strain CCMP2564" /LENGTH=83 /DNA_ID=CAMNT_0021296429 /DNA_START=286 /DNA_END=537 /DNA_ORIENTATION=-